MINALVFLLSLALLLFAILAIIESYARDQRELREKAKLAIKARIELIERKISERVEFNDLKELKQQINSTLNVCNKYQKEYCPDSSLNKEINNVERKVDEYISIIENSHKAKVREDAKDYEAAIILWEKLGEIKEAARVRTLQAELGAIKVSQKVVQGDEVTEIKDSIVSKSNVGSGGPSKMQELRDLTEMKEKSLIDDDEFKKMKKEILGK